MELYIQQRTSQEELFARLQQQSLARLQALCRELWTDYNPHDPGVTICDVLNYALTELDYRLRFNIQDYLTSASSGFTPGRYGLFDGREVLPVSPVTVSDYRKMMIDRIEEIRNLWIYPVKGSAGKAGWYEILVELKPDAGIGIQEKVREEVGRLFNAHRNLCEGLQRVVFVRRKPLVLAGEMEVVPGTDVTRMFARIYWVASQFFVSGIRYRRVEEALADGITWEQILDGPDLQHWMIEEDSLKEPPRVYSLSHLYRQLKKLRGIKDIRSLAFRDGERLYTDFIPAGEEGSSFTVVIPVRKEETGVCMLVGGARVEPDFSRLAELLYARQAHQYGKQNRTSDLSPFLEHPEGKYRDLYTHESVRNDFPECYGVNRLGVASGEPELRKAQAAQLGAYLLLFDEVFARGLKELQQLPRLLDITLPPEKETRVPLSAPEVQWEKLVQNGPAEEDRQRQWREKTHWAALLDRLYGENSLPDWLQSSDFYEDNEEDRLMQRLRFLQQVPDWGRMRFRGVDLYRCTAGNVPGIKAYVAALLGFESWQERPVMNVFPMYNLRLISDRLFYRYRGQLLSHHLVPEELLRTEHMENIPLQPGEFSAEDYHILRDKLPLLHYNLLFEGLFREGIRLTAYRLLNLPLQSERLLLFYHSGQREWINLGRFGSREDVFDTANRLKRFLVMLNRKCETLYLVEHLYITGEAFRISVVLPGWSARLSDAFFREACELLICSRLPAHLNVSFHWLSARRMWQFERLYFAWRQAFAAGNECSTLAEQLKKLIL